MPKLTQQAAIDQLVNEIRPFKKKGAKTRDNNEIWSNSSTITLLRAEGVPNAVIHHWWLQALTRVNNEVLSETRENRK